MGEDDSVLPLIEAIYEAAECPERWPSVLAMLGAALQAPAAVLHLQHTTAEQAGQVQAAVGVDPAAQASYESHYASTNIWTIRGRNRLREGAVLTGQMICSDAELERSEYYTDYLRHLDFFHSIAAIPVCSGDASLIFTALRQKASGAFGDDAVRLMRELSPHLRRAVRIHRHFSALSAANHCAMGALDLVNVGVIALDSSGKMLFANRAARALGDRNGVRLTPAGPRPRVPADGERLRALIQRARSTGGRRGGIMHLTSASEGERLQILVAPITPDGPGIGVPGTVVAIFLTDSGQRQVPRERLRELYGLTLAEARTAGGLAEGKTILEIAERDGVTSGTARWLVKQVLHKTESRSQAEAVGRILTSLAARIAGAD